MNIQDDFQSVSDMEDYIVYSYDNENYYDEYDGNWDKIVHDTSAEMFYGVNDSENEYSDDCGEW